MSLIKRSVGLVVLAFFGLSVCAGAEPQGTIAGSRDTALLSWPKGVPSPPLARRDVPPPPSVVGCYEYIRAWRRTACRTRAYAAKHYPPAEYLPAITYKKVTGSANRRHQSPEPITGGAVGINITRFGSLNDPTWGRNAFSIQFNSNGFTGSNGDDDWVQFVDQSKPGQPDGLCIWNIDLTVGLPNGYHQTCGGPASNPPRSIRADDWPILFADYNPSASNPSVNVLKLMAILPWYSSSIIYSVVANDANGLTQAGNGTGRWTEVFGSILGFGNNSTADFTKAKIGVSLVSLDCRTDACTNNTGPWSAQSTHRAVKLSAGTGEQNNLRPTDTFGPTTTALPGLQCTVPHACGLYYIDTAS
jgi:hypothetical protein